MPRPRANPIQRNRSRKLHPDLRPGKAGLRVARPCMARHGKAGTMIMMDLVERSVRYMMMIECKFCGDEVYPDEDEARELVRFWIDDDGMKDIEGLKERIDRTCDHCEDVLTRDD